MSKRWGWVLAVVIGGAVGFLAGRGPVRVDSVAVDAAQAGEACCEKLRHCEVELDAERLQ